MTKPGSQAYYDSIAELYASWDVYLIKVDDMESHLYQPAEMKALRLAERYAGAPHDGVGGASRPSPLDANRRARLTLGLMARTDASAAQSVLVCLSASARAFDNRASNRERASSAVCESRKRSRRSSSS